MKRIYIACPYSHQNPEIRNVRFEIANAVSALFIEHGYSVFSPISMSHPIARHMGNHNDSEFWVNIDLDWLKECHTIVVVKAPGWDFSSGINRELNYARDLGIEIRYIDPGNMEVSDEI